MRTVAAILMLSLAICAQGVPPAHAQAFGEPPHAFKPPPPAPPPPRIEVPKIPKMDEIPTSPKAALPQRDSFSDRMTRCIEQGAGAGLGPNENAAYSRACAN